VVEPRALAAVRSQNRQRQIRKRGLEPRDLKADEGKRRERVWLLWKGRGYF